MIENGNLPRSFNVIRKESRVACNRLAVFRWSIMLREYVTTLVVIREADSIGNRDGYRINMRRQREGVDAGLM